MGFLSDRLAHKLTRPTFFLFASLLMTVGMVYMAFADTNMLYFGTVLVGFSFGTNFALMPGKKVLCTNNPFIFTSPLFSSDGDRTFL